MRRLLVGGLLERVHAHALRVGAAQHVGDGGVLAGGVDPLQYDEQRALLLRVHASLQVGDLVDEAGELVTGVVGVVVGAGVGGVLVGERHLHPGLDPVQRGGRWHGVGIPATMGVV